MAEEQPIVEGPGVEVVDTAATQLPAATVNGEIFVSELDRLRATNISLRLINAVNREALAQHGIKDAQRAALEATAERERFAQESAVVRAELAVKYGIDFTTHQINDQDGKLIPRPRT